MPEQALKEICSSMGWIRRRSVIVIDCVYCMLLQFFYVLKGKLLFQVNDQEFTLLPQSSIDIPGGT